METRIEETRDIARLHGTVADTTARRDDFDERFEPVHAARAIANDARVDVARLGFFGDRLRSRLCAERERAGIARNVNVDTHDLRRHCASNSSKRCGVTFPQISSSFMTAGEHAQLPRQYTGSSVNSPSAVVS